MVTKARNKLEKLQKEVDKAEEDKEKDRIRFQKLNQWRIEGKQQGKAKLRFPPLKDTRIIPSSESFIG